MISDAALTEKNRGVCVTTIAKEICERVEVLLYPCLLYHKGGNYSNHVCYLLELVDLATESELYWRIRRRSQIW